MENSEDKFLGLRIIAACAIVGLAIGTNAGGLGLAVAGKAFGISGPAWGSAIGSLLGWKLRNSLDP